MQKKIAIICLIVFIIMLVFLTAEFYGPQNFSNITGILFTGYHLIYRIIIGSIASLGMICSVFLFDSTIRNNKVLRNFSVFGRYTLTIYILQTFIIEAFLSSFLKFDNISLILFYFVIAPAISITTILLSVLAAKIFEKSKITEFFFLGHEYRTY